MKITITITGLEAKSIKKEFAGVGEAMTWLNTEAQAKILNKVEVDSKKQEDEN